MDYLKEWVRGLVMLVLLAGCLEMLLPMNAMKKYVRLTMGLFIVLSVVKPVVALLGQSVVVDTQMFETDAGRSLPTIGQIMEQADQFREKNRTLVAAEAETRLGEMAREAALAVRGISDARATVTLAEAAETGVQIKAVTVFVTPGPRYGAVKPVEPVRVGDQPAARSDPPTAEELQLADTVRREVAARLGVNADPNLVRVEVDRR